MGIPDPMGASAACDALDYFHAAGFNRVDTAILYQEGKTEVTLGKEKPALENKDTVIEYIRLLCTQRPGVYIRIPETDGRRNKKEDAPTQMLRAILLCFGSSPPSYENRFLPCFQYIRIRRGWHGKVPRGNQS